MTDRLESKRWTVADLAMLVLLVLVTIWTGREALLDILNRGFNGTDSTYVLFAPFVVAALVWYRRHLIEQVRFQPDLLGSLVVLAGILISSYGFDRDIIILWQGGVLISLIGCVFTMAGFRILKLFAPAVFAVFLFLPIPGTIRDNVAIPLQSIATGLTALVLEFFSVDAIRHGNLIVINGEQVAVGEACNGMPMIMGVGMAVYAIVFALRLSPRKRAALLIASPVIALFCNVLRLVPTSLAFGLSDPLTASYVYAVGGWLMIPAAIVMLFAFLTFLFAEETFVDRITVE